MDVLKSLQCPSNEIIVNIMRWLCLLFMRISENFPLLFQLLSVLQLISMSSCAPLSSKSSLTIPMTCSTPDFKTGICLPSPDCCGNRNFSSIPGLCGASSDSICCFTQNLCQGDFGNSKKTVFAEKRVNCAIRNGLSKELNGTCVQSADCCAFPSIGKRSSCGRNKVCCPPKYLCETPIFRYNQYALLSDRETASGTSSSVESGLKSRATRNENCSNVKTKPRSDWKPSINTSYLKLAINAPVKHVFIHRTNTITCDDPKTCVKVIQVLQRIHVRTQNMKDIGYNFVIGGDKTVYETRGWTVADELTSSYGIKSISIGIIGDFKTSLPSELVFKALGNFLRCGQEMGHISKKYQLHFVKQCTTTGDDALYEKIKKWPTFSEQIPKESSICL